MPQPVPFVFVSATSDDLRSYRHAARDQLLVGGAYPVVQEYFEPDHRALREFLRDKVARCDAVICLVGFVYGAEPPVDPTDPNQARRSYTQIEYDVARELGKPIYVFLAQADCAFDREMQQDATLRELQLAHRSALEAHGAKWTPFNSHEQLKTRIAEIIPHLPRAAGRLAPRLEHPPTVPAYFAGRGLELRQLDRALHERTPAVVVVLGIGGQGKTTLVHRWLQDHDPPAFDALFWCTAYRGGFSFDNFLDRILSYLLGDEFDKRASPTVEARVARLLQALEERRALVVIDGVERWLRGWHGQASGPQTALDDSDRDPSEQQAGLDDFLRSATAMRNGSHLVLTSRALPSALDATQKALVPVLKEEESAELSRAGLGGLANGDAVDLLRRLSVEGSDRELLAVAQRYANHPLALTVLGAQLAERFGGRLAALPEYSPLRSGDLSKLLHAMREHLPLRDQSERFLQVAALCREDPSLRAIAAGLGDSSPRSLVELLDLAVLLARWQVLAWEPHTQVVRLHPLIKQLFAQHATDAVAIHDRLAHYYANQSLAPHPTSLQDVSSVFLAIEHRLSGSSPETAAELAFARVSSGFTLIEWLAAWGHLQTGIELLERIADACSGLERAEILSARGAMLTQLGQPRLAAPCFDQAIELGESLRPLDEARALRVLGGAFLNRGNARRDTMEIESSRHDFDRAILAFATLAARDSLALQSLVDALINRGNSLRDLGRLTAAREDYHRALGLADGHLGSTRQAQRARLAARLNSAIAQAGLGDFIGAAQELQQLLDASTEPSGDWGPEAAPLRAYVTSTLGIVLHEAGKSPAGLRELRRGIEQLQQLVDAGRRDLLDRLARARMNLASALTDLQQWAEAESDANIAVALFRELYATVAMREGELAHALLIRSKVWTGLGDTARATSDRNEGFDRLRRLSRSGVHHCTWLLFNRLASLASQHLELAPDSPLGLELLRELLTEADKALSQPAPAEALLAMLRRVLRIDILTTRRERLPQAERQRLSELESRLS